MIDLLDEGYQDFDVGIAEAATRVVTLKLFDEPARVVNADAQTPIRLPQKGSSEHAQLGGLRSGKRRQLAAPPAVDEAVLEVDSHARISPLEQPLNLAEQRAHVAMMSAEGASRCRSRLAKSFKARRTSLKPPANSS